MQKLEVEVKFYLADIEPIRANILELGAKSNGRVFETNIRYEDKNNSLMKKKSLLRLRQDEKVTLTLKSSPPVRSKEFKFLKSWRLKSANLRLWAKF